MITWPQSPQPSEIESARKSLGLTMAAAGSIVGAPSVRTWQNWANGQRKMPGVTWQVWRWCTGLDPWPKK